MKLYITVVSLLAAVAAVMSAAWHDDAVWQFSVEEQKEDLRLFEFLMGNHGKKASRLGNYKFINCGDPKKEVLNVTRLLFAPDPLVFPGTFYVNFEGGIKETMDSPLKTVVVLERKVGSTWLKIPCIGTIGSCTYDDLCDVLSGAVCPQPFVDHKIPCKCPFTAGNYTLPKTGFEVDVSVFPSGDYHARANMTRGDTFVACIEVYASFD